MRHVLFNPLSSHCYSVEDLTKILREINAEEDLRFVDATQMNVEEFVKGLGKDDEIVISGGDGTLNRLVNAINFDELPNKVYLHKAGNGNDFLRDVNELKEDFIEITDLVKGLPVVTVNGQTSKFINGVGFGVDGMVCVESDKMKAAGKKDINYTTLAIKLLLFKYKKVNAVVNVDGKEYSFKKVYIGSAMNGKYYGGGMREAPDQDRKSDTVSVVVWHKFGPLTALMNFPKIFEGKHVLNKKHITVLTGKNITMTYSKPTDLQVDGESYHAVTTYNVVKK